MPSNRNCFRTTFDSSYAKGGYEFVNPSEALPEVSKNVRWYEIHRWLNPFAKQRATMVTPLTPKEIEDALRPHLWGYTWKSRLDGSLKPWGFTLRRGFLGQPCLTVNYQPSSDCTQLGLTYGRTKWGIIGWFWTFVVWPYAVVAFFREIGAGESSVTTADDLWPSQQFWFEQPVMLIFVAILSMASILGALVVDLRRRNDLQYFQGVLADLIGARDETTATRRTDPLYLETRT